MDFVEILGLVGSIGSILGFIGTLWAFFQQRALKKRYMLLLRGPQLLKDLLEHASTISNLVQDLPNTERALQLELEKTSSIVDNLSIKVRRPVKKELDSLVGIIQQQQPPLRKEGIHYVHRTIHKVASNIRNYMEDVRSGT